MTPHDPAATPRRDRIRRRGTAAAVCLVLAAGGASAATAASAAPPAESDGSAFSAQTADQVSALQTVKSTETKAERKIDSRLLLAVRQHADASVLSATPRLQLGIDVSTSGTTVVDVQVTGVTEDLISRLAGVGATVTGKWSSAGVVRATVPLDEMTTVASWADVEHVAPPVAAETQGAAAPTQAPAGDQAARIGAALRGVVPAAGQGAVVSEGDRADAAAQARSTYHVTGVGVKVCVLSDGVDSLSDSQASGELPDVDVLPGQEGEGDEGTAMLEIVHDLAPNATLGFATAFTSEAQFTQNIRALRFTGHCDVIVDDVIYYDENPFQDGPLARAVNAVHADGALYFSSAGNQGNLLSGTSGTWEGDFNDSGRRVGKVAGTAHDFDPRPGVQVFDPLSPGSAGAVTTLFWSDPAGAAADDYDLYVFDGDGNVVSMSQNVQDGDDDPFEILQVPFGSDLRIAVVKYRGADQYFQVTAFGGRFAASDDGLQAFATAGAQRGHADAQGAVSVAAAPADKPLPFKLEAGDPPNPSGPFPGAFTAQQIPEPFTSDGPRRVFFRPDGTPLTPGNTSSTGGQVRVEPELLAADGVSTSVDGFSPFFGTSAAAPHAAAIAALALSGNPRIEPDAVTEAMRASAIDLRPAGQDPRSGAGAVRADKMLALLGATPQPRLGVRTPTVAPRGDGDAYLEPGESGILSIPVADTGDGRATAVNVTATSRDAGVTITPSSRSYGAIDPGAAVTRQFTIKLATNYPNGQPARLQVRATSANGADATAFRSVPTGEPATSPARFSYVGPPVAIPDDDPAGVAVPLQVSGVGYASSVRFSIGGSQCTTDQDAATVGISHTYVGDLAGTLTAPGGATAQLFSGSGTSGNNLCQVVFDDTASEPFSSVTYLEAPFQGSYLPIDPLGRLLGRSVDGTWTFTVSDNTPADTGSVRSFRLTFTGFQAP